MPQSQDLLTTQAFAEKTGVSAGTVSKWLRSGRISGQKKNGKWMIAEKELSKVAKSSQAQSQPSAPAKPKSASITPKGSTYSVAEFSSMTYLTEFGVRLWLKSGRLISAMDGSGRQGVDAASLEHPYVKRLLR